MTDPAFVEEVRATFERTFARLMAEYTRVTIDRTPEWRTPDPGIATPRIIESELFATLKRLNRRPRLAIGVTCWIDSDHLGVMGYRFFNQADHVELKTVEAIAELLDLPAMIFQ